MDGGIIFYQYVHLIGLIGWLMLQVHFTSCITYQKWPTLKIFCPAIEMANCTSPNANTTSKRFHIHTTMQMEPSCNAVMIWRTLTWNCDSIGALVLAKHTHCEDQSFTSPLYEDEAISVRSGDFRAHVTRSVWA